MNQRKIKNFATELLRLQEHFEQHATRIESFIKHKGFSVYTTINKPGLESFFEVNKYDSAERYEIAFRNGKIIASKNTGAFMCSLYGTEGWKRIAEWSSFTTFKSEFTKTIIF